MARSTPSLGPSSQPLSPGRVVGGAFEILGVLGEGGTGIVYEARRRKVGDVVALKVIHSHLAGDRQVRGRFTREAAILRRLEGKHMVPVLEFGELAEPDASGANGLLYLVLPRVEGIALDRLVKRDGALPIPRAVAILDQISEALKDAHAQGIIHRDLKPGNVLIAAEAAGQSASPTPEEHAFVVDFGMAKIVTGGGGTGTTALTQHNMVFGTPEYMAPEQARGDELDARCDVYAAGVILYELLTGEVPFQGATPLNVLTAHLTAEPVPPRERAPERGISVALEAVVLHAMAKDPGLRYSTASALQTALRSAMAAPEDAAAVRPAVRVLVDAEAEAAHAPTIPSPMASDRPPSSPHNEPARRGSGAPSADPRSGRSPEAPADLRSGRPPPASSGDARRGSTPVSASGRPLGHASDRAPALVEPTGPSRGWTLVWILAALIGISVGVWLSLR